MNLVALLCTAICAVIIIGAIDSWWNGYRFSKTFHIVESIVFCVLAGLSIYCWVYVANHSHDYYRPELKNVERGEAHVDTVRRVTYCGMDSCVSVKYVIEWNKERRGNGAAENK